MKILIRRLRKNKSWKETLCDGVPYTHPKISNVTFVIHVEPPLLDRFYASEITTGLRVHSDIPGNTISSVEKELSAFIEKTSNEKIYGFIEEWKKKLSIS